MVTVLAIRRCRVSGLFPSSIESTNRRLFSVEVEIDVDPVAGAHACGLPHLSADGQHGLPAH